MRGEELSHLELLLRFGILVVAGKVGLFEVVQPSDTGIAVVDALRRNEAPDSRQRIHVGVMADDRARIEDAVASHFHTVPQHGTEFLKAGRDLFFSVLYHHQCLVGFYIGGDGTGAHMCPVAQNGIAHIIVMGHLHPIE